MEKNIINKIKNIFYSFNFKLYALVFFIYFLYSYYMFAYTDDVPFTALIIYFIIFSTYNILLIIPFNIINKYIPLRLLSYKISFYIFLFIYIISCIPAAYYAMKLFDDLIVTIYLLNYMTFPFLVISYYKLYNYNKFYNVCRNSSFLKELFKLIFSLFLFIVIFILLMPFAPETSRLIQNYTGITLIYD